MKTFYIKTLGCKTNQLESAVIEEKMKTAGYQYTKDFNVCDIFILNSCSVTQTTDDDSLKLISHIKSVNPNVFMILTGCFAQLKQDELKKNNNIDLILGNDDKFDIVQHIEKNTKCCVSDIMKVYDFNSQFVNDLSKTRANLKIQDGCNNRCSYCTIPFARGNSRSNSVENIIEQIQTYEQHGFKEIVLTGIHIGQWGQDFTPSKTLFDLLKEIEKTNIKRYRLGSLNPLEINEELLDFLSKSEKFCPHFHLSLQSANNKILDLMNRKYSVELYLEQIKQINSHFRLPFIGADIIVGFPNETQDDYEITKNNLLNSGLSKIHVFPYSKRNNTAAFDMENQVDEIVKKNRAKDLQTVSQMLFNGFMKKNLGQFAEVMIEKHFDKNGYLKGITGNYINVTIEDNDKDKLNTMQKVELVKINANKMIGKII